MPFLILTASVALAADSVHRATTSGAPDLNNGLIALSTAAMALFTFFLWRIQITQHRMRNYARLQVCTSKASFESSTRKLRVEVLLLNASDAPAVIEKWVALVRQGEFQQSVADGSLGPTKLMKVPAYIGGKGWVIERIVPTALSLHKDLAQLLHQGAAVHVEIQYAGGHKVVTTLRHTTLIEIS